MWEAIGQAIKTFVEKHLIPTVISVIIAISSFLILPTDFWMIERIGKVPFALLVAGIAFLIIQLLKIYLFLRFMTITPKIVLVFYLFCIFLIENKEKWERRCSVPP